MVTTVSPGFEEHVDDLLGSLAAYGNVPDALIALFAVDPGSKCEQLARKHDALLVRCTARGPVNATLKAVMYSAPHVVDAERFVCLDGDMLVLDDLTPLFAAADACPPDTILACREANDPMFSNLGEILTTIYGGTIEDIQRITGAAALAADESFPLVVNDGLFAGSRTALLRLDQLIRGWCGAADWVDENLEISWRNQFVFNLALARLGTGVELDPVWNVQLNYQDVSLGWESGRLRARWRERHPRILHFNGLGRGKHRSLRGCFTSLADPLPAPATANYYEEFLQALRAWVGRRGVGALAWSFYGRPDAHSADVPDAAAFPVLGLLHYLVRANGCVRVLETGTAKGVSAACLASAVAHRDPGRVVTIDLERDADCEELWSLLPAAMQSVIEFRGGDSLEVMAEALERHERFEAVLLDSLHEEEHVLAEWALARQLVCPGGLIVIHDVALPSGSVGAAVRRIESSGEGVARLLCAEHGHAEEAGLGLAVITPQQLVAKRRRREGRRIDVTCLMPTRDRPDFARRAIDYFRRQDYAGTELLILDDGLEPIKPLVPNDRRIRYVRLDEQLVLGAKRNRGCELARGELILHWDDDDWYSPNRVRVQVDALRRLAADIVGIDRELFIEPRRRRAWAYSYPPDALPWLAGSSLGYPRRFWESHRFEELPMGEDTQFVWSANDATLVALEDHRIMVGVIHKDNASPKDTTGAGWSPYPLTEIEEFIGEDAAYYQRLCPAGQGSKP